MLADALRVLASWHTFKEWELILVLSAGTVLAVLVLNFLVDAGCELWACVSAVYGGPHAVDSARIHRETAGEVARLAGRAPGAASGAGAGQVSAAVGSVSDADAASGNALLAELTGLPSAAAKLDRETDYGIGTTLYAVQSQAHRVGDPLLAGRDLV